MIETLLPNQEIFLDLLRGKMQLGETLFFVRGISGSGKSISLQKISQDFKESGILPIYFKGDPILVTNEYFPFLNALSETLPFTAEYGLKEVVIDYGADIPKIGGTVTNILKIFSKRNETRVKIRDLSLTEKEQDIICKIQYLAEHNDLIFICDNLNYWDEKSIKLLYLLLGNIKGKYNFLSKCVFLIVYTSNKDCPQKKIVDAIQQLSDVNTIEFPVLQSNDFERTLKILGYSGNLSPKERQILFSLVNGHVRMLTELVTELKGNKLALNDLEGKSKELLAVILKQRLEDCGATGEQIKETLEYASLLGLSFSVYELNRILEIEDNVFQRVINRSNEMNLIEKSDCREDILQFAHDIIREIFEKEIGENNDYYKKIGLCLKEIEPGQYMRRAQYALKAANYRQAYILFALEAVRQIREDGSISELYLENCKKLYGDSANTNIYLKFILLMKDAYCLYRQGNYDSVLNMLQSVNNLYPKELLAEKEILCSYCYTKRIEAGYRAQGLESLRYFGSFENCNSERDIYERVLIRLMILYVHLGDITNARATEKMIVDSLKERFNHDETSRSRFYTINRISTSLYSCAVAENKMKEAVDYFGINYKTGIWRDIKQFFLSQVNYAGALCLNGKFKDSYQKNDEMMKLMQQFPDYSFPRPNILINNFIISAYLSKQLTAEECKEIYKDFLSTVPLCAERLFYSSNYSIFLALSGDLKGAIQCITEESDLQNFKNDGEQIYNYRVALNTGVYRYLAGQKDNGVEIIKGLKEQMEANTLTGDLEYALLRANKLLTIMRSEIEVSPIQWEDILLRKESEFQVTAWNYYGKGFVFTTVFNWDL